MIKKFKESKCCKYVEIVAFLLVFLILFNIVTVVFENKTDDVLKKDYSDFGKETFDVVFLGSSVMMNDIYPLQLFNEQGIASYNWGCGSQSVASSYYLAKLAIDEQKPDLIVFDCNMCQEGELYSSEEKFHYVTDNISLTQKYEMVTKLAPKNSWNNFFFEMGVYHTRWKELSQRDFFDGKTGTYGAKVHYVSNPLGEFTITNEKAPLPEISEEYLRKIIELCKEKDVPLLLTVLPMNFSAQYDIYDRNIWQTYYNTIQDIADEYGVKYLNFMHHFDEVGLDREKDFEGDTHLNAWGATKMTSFIGSFIRQNYEITDVRDNPKYDFMKRDYDKFAQMIIDLEPKE